MRAVLVLLMMVASALLSACTIVHAADPAIARRIEFPQPQGWVATTRREMDGEVTGYTEYGEQLVSRAPTEPLILYSKYKEPYRAINPAVSILVIEAVGVADVSPEKLIGLMIPQFEKMFRKSKIIIPPTTTSISGYPAAVLTFQVDIPFALWRSYHEVVRIWTVRVDGWFVTISAGWPANDRQTTEAEMMRIVETIRIRPATP